TDEANADPEEAEDVRRIRYSCPKEDDMVDVAEALDAADELLVVCPLYFAGPPAQMKALIDRLQPYFHSDLRKGELRPAALHVIGDGKNPHGWQPLADILGSALTCAGFRLTTVLDWTGKMTEDGEITADADEYDLTEEW
ncbi:MAG: flavodoxin family protein, partial [Eggerthellaceae bacterium]|nr:flavodoxin family protein [Eggerthellaceae bacterium]